MTELNQEPRTEPSVDPEPLPREQLDHASGPGGPPEAAEEAPAVAAGVDWPALQAQGQAHGQDPAVSAVLDRLAAVRLTPVSGHGEVYAGMHDALLEALNEDVASHAGLARRIHAAGDGGA
jgi:hypothetical protein